MEVECPFSNKILQAKVKYGTYLNILKIGMSESFQLFGSLYDMTYSFVHCQAKDFALEKLFKNFYCSLSSLATPLKSLLTLWGFILVSFLF